MSERHPTGPRQPTRFTVLGWVALLLMPFGLTVPLALRASEPNPMMWGAVAAQALILLWAIGTRRLNPESVGPVLILLYVAALGGVVIARPKAEEWLVHLTQAVLLVVPVWLFGLQILHDSGATALRRARSLAARLMARKDWPADLARIRQLPEVQALREALHVDADPALEMLANPRPAVRVAALAALEFRPIWRPGQPVMVLQLAQRAPEAEVRAAAVNALANIEDRGLVEALGELLRDPNPLVRRTTTEALLWNTETRWPWLRNAVRLALASPAAQEDGALRLTGHPLTNEAVNDLHVWAAEKGLTAYRAALTLGVHYSQYLASGSEPEQVAALRTKVLDPQTPPVLRLELARLLHQYHELREEDLMKLLQPTMPAPVRLIAVEVLLGQEQCPEALAALHDLARLPNREIALMTADVVQRRLGIDLGLPRNQPAPPVQSRTAAEVARRVLVWAAHHEVPDRAPDGPKSYSDSRVNLG
jgi:hypothetical protein